MDSNDIINHIMITPANTNPNILRSQFDERDKPIWDNIGQLNDDIADINEQLDSAVEGSLANTIDSVVEEIGTDETKDSILGRISALESGGGVHIESYVVGTLDGGEYFTSEVYVVADAESQIDRNFYRIHGRLNAKDPASLPQTITANMIRIAKTTTTIGIYTLGGFSGTGYVHIVGGEMAGNYLVPIYGNTQGLYMENIIKGASGITSMYVDLDLINFNRL